MENSVTVIGAGLAGCEAAWALARAGIATKLYEMKPKKFSPAHKYEGFAELVCSNSLKAERIGSAAGMLKEEMRLLGSLTIECAQLSRVAAGGALAVDRKRFSDLVTEKIRSHPLIDVINDEAVDIPQGNVIIAAGPLASQAISEAIKRLTGKDQLYFHDAAAPIVSADSIDMQKVFYASRYGRGEADYINCPMKKDEYERFYNELINAESAPLHDFDIRDDEGETSERLVESSERLVESRERLVESHKSFKVYEGCMPIEVLAKRGADTMRYGPLKPVGITDPKTSERFYAVVQLRAENAQRTMFNLVGFQTNLKFGEQKRVFSLIPGLENAEFLRYGVMHRNTYINSPVLLTEHFNMRTRPEIFFAGQITGVEGYTESAASGIIAGINAARRITGRDYFTLPKESMTGALSAYIANASPDNFQPMGCNMGLLPPLEEHIRDKKARYEALALRGIEAMKKEAQRL